MRLIALGAACNNACVFCAQGDMRALAFAPPDVAPQIAAILPGEVVAFAGGEPTRWDDLPAWIRAAEAREPSRILVQTNGRRLAYRAFARALRQASPRLGLDMSLHGSTAPMHDYHTGAPGSFEQTVLGLRHARAERIPAGVTTVVTRSNFRHLLEIVRLAHAAGASAVHFARAEAFGRAAAHRDRVIPAPAMVLPFLRRAEAEAERLGLGVLGGERASAPEVAAQFVGLGAVEPALAREGERAQERRLSLAVLGRPAPAKGEVRGADKRSGADLARIFPALFEPEPKAGGLG
jgi:MoaA/NifB/PqqE/SkfB family radical SAM enzyme